MAWYRAGIPFFFAIISLLLSSCDRPLPGDVQKQPVSQREILIGLIPEQNVFRQRERYMVLRNYLAEQYGIIVNYTSLNRYGNILESFTREKMDGAFFGSFTYALAHSQLDVEPLVRPVNLDGTSTYRGYIIARKNSRIDSVLSLKHKRFAFVDRATMAGYLFPLAYFREHEVTNLKSYLDESLFAGSYDEVVRAVLNQEADAGAAKNTIYDQLALENPRIEKELKVVAVSGLVPQNCLAVRSDLDPELKSALKKALLDMEKSSKGVEALRAFGARGFIETTTKDFEYLYRIAEQVGIDFKTYHYTNR